MDIEQMREYCLSKPYSFECTPFGDDNLVFKVGGKKDKEAKMFALLSLDSPHYIALKCDPREAIRLRDIHSEITPAYHFNKKHWNGVQIDGSLESQLVMELIDHSYDLVFGSLTRKTRDILLGF